MPGVKLIKFEEEYEDGCKVIHYIHPDRKDLIEKWKQNTKP